jgi:CRP-like cAMP-binding protein
LLESGKKSREEDCKEYNNNVSLASLCQASAWQFLAKSDNSFARELPMARTSFTSTSKKTTATSDAGVNGRPVHNKILLHLPQDECAIIFPNLEFVSLPTPTVLNETGEPIKYVFFLNSGLASILSIMADGKTVEVGLCGSEGFVGGPLTAGLHTSPTRVIMQVEGCGFRMATKDFIGALVKCPKLAIALQRFAHEIALQASQVAACNRLHEVEERLARWLLMSQDRLGGNLVPLTQEFLAHMLGTRRASVTVAAGILQKAGLITYTRGSVKIENRLKLEDASCECYGIMLRQLKKWQAQAN